MKPIEAKFVRIGRLDSHNFQETWAGNDTSSYHKAPARRGFYACPLQLQESFLTGNLPETQPDLFPKDKTFEKVEGAMKRNRHVFTLKDSDLIWHHLDRSKGILQRKHTWVLTSVHDWKAGVYKQIGILTKGHVQYLDDTYIVDSLAAFDKDDFEVFIPKETKV
jgi:hypothetical protein